MKDVCVSCGKETAYEISTHVDMRNGYVEGLGQLCPSCYTHGTNRNHILVPEAVIINTPNNDELGSKVRQLYYDTKE
jgi:NMD protein affecting ribosome stability and mRNA decay